MRTSYELVCSEMFGVPESAPVLDELLRIAHASFDSTGTKARALLIEMLVLKQESSKEFQRVRKGE